MSFPESPYKSNCLQGRVCLITGGGSGIGFEIARQMALHGTKVCLMGRRAPVLEAAADRIKADGGEAIITPGDVRSFESCQAAVKTTVDALGRLDTLVNCAAGNFLSAAEVRRPRCSCKREGRVKGAGGQKRGGGANRLGLLRGGRGCGFAMQPIRFLE